MLELHDPARLGHARSGGAAGVNHAWVGPPTAVTPRERLQRRSGVWPTALGSAPAQGPWAKQPAQHQDPGPACPLVSESFGRWVKENKARLWKGGWWVSGGLQPVWGAAAMPQTDAHA